MIMTNLRRFNAIEVEAVLVVDFILNLDDAEKFGR